MTNGFVKGRPRLGITFSLVSSTYAMYYSTPTGVMVESIDKNSSAYKAGLRAGDIITKFDGVKIDSTEQVLQLMEKHKPNDVVVLTVFRRPNDNTADQTFELKVTLDEDNGQTGEIMSPVKKNPLLPSRIILILTAKADTQIRGISLTTLDSVGNISFLRYLCAVDQQFSAERYTWNKTLLFSEKGFIIYMKNLYI